MNATFDSNIALRFGSRPLPDPAHGRSASQTLSLTNLLYMPTHSIGGHILTMPPRQVAAELLIRVTLKNLSSRPLALIPVYVGELCPLFSYLYIVYWNSYAV